MSFGFVFGPVLGSILVSHSIRLCFGISTFFAFIALLLAYFLLDESSALDEHIHEYEYITTNTTPTTTDNTTPTPTTTNTTTTTTTNNKRTLRSTKSIYNITKALKWNPFQGLIIFFNNNELRKLSVPYILGNLSHGMYVYACIVSVYEFVYACICVVCMYICMRCMSVYI